MADNRQTSDGNDFGEHRKAHVEADRNTDMSKHMSVLYHFTSVLDAVSIMQQKMFRLSYAGGTSQEAKHQHGYNYYLSTTRSKVGRYTVTESHWQGVVFTLNAAWFSHNYKIRPVDYWERGFDKVRESEDRIISNKATMPLDLKQAVLSIHIYIKDQKEDEKLGNVTRKLIMMAKLNKIPVHVYGDKTAFLAQNTRKAVPLSDLKSFLNSKIEPYKASDFRERFAKKDIYPYLELIHKNGSKHLSPAAKSARYNLSYPDAIENLQAKLHNGKKSAATMSKLTSAMRQLKVSTPQELIEHLRKKWEEIGTVEHAAEMKKWKADKKRKLIEKHIAKKQPSPNTDTAAPVAKYIYTAVRGSMLLTKRRGKDVTFTLRKNDVFGVKPSLRGSYYMTFVVDKLGPTYIFDVPNNTAKRILAQANPYKPTQKTPNTPAMHLVQVEKAWRKAKPVGIGKLPVQPWYILAKWANIHKGVNVKPVELLLASDYVQHGLDDAKRAVQKDLQEYVMQVHRGLKAMTQLFNTRLNRKQCIAVAVFIKQPTKPATSFAKQVMFTHDKRWRVNKNATGYDKVR